MSTRVSSDPSVFKGVTRVNWPPEGHGGGKDKRKGVRVTSPIET